MARRHPRCAPATVGNSSLYNHEGLSSHIINDRQVIPSSMYRSYCTTDALSLWRRASGQGSQGDLSLATWMDSLNDGLLPDELERQGCDVISMSHFLPYQVCMAAVVVSFCPWPCSYSIFGMSTTLEPWLLQISNAVLLTMQELLPEKRFLFLPQLAQASGSDPLAARLEQLRPDMHIFGHTHFSWNAAIRGQCAPGV